MGHLKASFKALIVCCVTAFMCIAVVSAAHAQQKNCGQELQDGHADFLKKLRIHNFNSGAASGSGKAAKQLTAWLKQSHDEVVRHEKAHKVASGKWGGKIEYLYYTWWNIPYATAGCHIPKRGRPLEVAIKAALAPEQPSKIDLRNVEMWKKELKRRKRR